MEEKDSQGIKGLAIIIALVVVAVIVVILLVKGCGAKEYTVKFDSMGGSAVSSVTVKENETVKEPTAPTKDGYTFAGWYLDDAKYDFNTKVTKDITLKAHWDEANTGDFVLDVTSLSLTVGSSRQVKATLSGDLKDAKLTWKSSNESIATVDSKGNIKALKEGEVTITVSTEDGKHTKTITVTVRPASDVTVTSVSISGAKEVEVGKSIKLTANVTPKNATNKKVTWKSSDTKIATVDKNGNVTGVKAGSVKITVTTEDGGKTKSVTITVKESTPVVKPDDPGQEDQPKEVKVSSITINGKDTMDYGSSQKLTVTVGPANATNKAVNWYVTEGATIDNEGNLKITGNPDVTKVTVTVKSKDGGATATFDVTVNAVYEITLTKIPQELGGSLQYNFAVTKNGEVFSGYKIFSYVDNGRTVKVSKDQGTAPDVKSNPTSATLVLSDGTNVTAKLNVKK